MFNETVPPPNEKKYCAPLTNRSLDSTLSVIGFKP